MTSYNSLQSVLKEFFDPLRTNDSRADSFVVYRRESGERYGEDVNTSLIFVSRPIPIPDAQNRTQAGLLSAVGSAFTTDVQSPQIGRAHV